MRRFTENPESHASEFLDELQTTKAKFLSLKEHMVDVTSRMIGDRCPRRDTRRSRQQRR